MLLQSVIIFPIKQCNPDGAYSIDLTAFDYRTLPPFAKIMQSFILMQKT